LVRRDHHAQLPFETASVPAAREFVRAHLGDWPGDRHVVELLTTELVTNALLHARTEFSVSLVIDGSLVRVEVEDASTTIPPRPAGTPPLDAVSGRRLFLVSTLAGRWGVVPHQTGKRIWFEVVAA
jgi:anti-sigma regulatory factor (Ser/Thr protein kinase)